MWRKLTVLLSFASVLIHFWVHYLFSHPIFHSICFLLMNLFISVLFPPVNFHKLSNSCIPFLFLFTHFCFIMRRNWGGCLYIYHLWHFSTWITAYTYTWYQKCVAFNVDVCSCKTCHCSKIWIKEKNPWFTLQNWQTHFHKFSLNLKTHYSTYSQLLFVSCQEWSSHSVKWSFAGYFFEAKH